MISIWCSARLPGGSAAASAAAASAAAEATLKAAQRAFNLFKSEPEINETMGLHKYIMGINII